MSLRRRLIDRPVENSLCQIPARHAIQVWLMIALLLAAFFQLKTGQSPQSARVMSHSLYLTQSVAMGLGATLCLISAVVARRKPWDALGLSLAGMIMLSAVGAYYSALIYLTSPNPLVSVAFWFVTCAIFLGTTQRAIQLAWLAVRIMRQR